jgi:hypothetical protein
MARGVIDFETIHLRVGAPEVLNPSQRRQPWLLREPLIYQRLNFYACLMAQQLHAPAWEDL